MVTKILVADDHAMIREGLRRILDATGKLEVCAEASDGKQVIEVLGQALPDVLLLDLSMPGTNGFDLIKRIKREWPDLPVLVLSMHDEEQYALRAIQAGALGYLGKENASTQLVNAIEKVASGRPFISDKVAEQLAMSAMPGAAKGKAHDELSNREMQVLQVLVDGKTVSQIAADLNVSVKTVSTHKSRILGKLRLNSLAELVRYSIENGLVDQVNCKDP